MFLTEETISQCTGDGGSNFLFKLQVHIIHSQGFFRYFSQRGGNLNRWADCRRPSHLDVMRSYIFREATFDQVYTVVFPKFVEHQFCSSFQDQKKELSNNLQERCPVFTDIPSGLLLWSRTLSSVQVPSSCLASWHGRFGGQRHLQLFILLSL